LYKTQQNYVPEKSIYKNASTAPDNTSIMDIALFVNRKLSCNEMYTIINNVWTPDLMFKFPIYQNFDNNKKGQTSKFQFNWLLRWP